MKKDAPSESSKNKANQTQFPRRLKRTRTSLQKKGYKMATGISCILEPDRDNACGGRQRKHRKREQR
jgi:hypothetical protein